MRYCLFVITPFLIYAAQGFAQTNELQTLPRDSDFAAAVQAMDMEQPTYSLVYKTGGTSLGLHVHNGSQNLGKFLPKNSSGDPEAQVVSYQLARFLNMDELVIPATYYTLRATATAKFKAMLASHAETNKWRAYNKSEILKEVAAHPTQLDGAFMPKLKLDSQEVIGLANESANTINSAHPIAQFIQANGPIPQKTILMSLKGVRAEGGKTPIETQWELARQFSNIMVLDILCGQWDRWSGGNVEAIYDPTTLRLQFLARDNGGASVVGTTGVQKYLGIVSRFDRAQITRVKHLIELLNGPNGAEFAAALGLRSDRRTLIQRANMLLAHVAQTSQSHGDSKTFF